MAETGLCSEACSCDIPCMWGKRGRFCDCYPLPSGIPCVQEDPRRLVFPPNPEAASLVYGKNFLAMSASTGGGAASPVCGKNRKFMLNAFQRQAASPVCGKNPSRNAICFPVTKVPVSTTVALYNRVLQNLHGRMSSGPPQPYFVSILRRGGNPAVWV